MRKLSYSAMFSLVIATLSSLSPQTAAQGTLKERSYPQSKAQIEKILKTLHPVTAGRLPTLEGFVVPGDIPLERFQRAYYQSIIQVTAVSSATSLVRVDAKISAWYADPIPARAGYRLMQSNGRIESDLLDRVAEAINGAAQPTENNSVTERPPEPEPALSAPLPRIPADATHGSFPASSLKSQTDAAEKHEQDLAAEAKGLEEILQSQSHPTNLVAIKKTGTAVLRNPAVDAKVLFSATAGDEFEILDTNSSWVHVRISGLSRGWIRRSSVEMPDESAGSKPNAGNPRQDQAPQFRLSNEQLAPFPGDWEPLRGKIVKIVTVQKTNETSSNSGQARLEFAHALFLKQYAGVSASADPPAGIVLIFDSDDGGMIAATAATLKMWGENALSDEAAWKQCFFDPPELLGTGR